MESLPQQGSRGVHATVAREQTGFHHDVGWDASSQQLARHDSVVHAQADGGGHASGSREQSWGHGKGIGDVDGTDRDALGGCRLDRRGGKRPAGVEQQKVTYLERPQPTAHRSGLRHGESLFVRKHAAQKPDRVGLRTGDHQTDVRTIIHDRLDEPPCNQKFNRRITMHPERPPQGGEHEAAR